MARECSGAAGELPCSPPGSHLGFIWAPFWLRFGVFVALDFLTRLLLDFGSILVSILAPFWCPNSTSEALGREKVDLQKTMFSLRKTMVLGFGECPGASKIAAGRHQKRTPKNTSKNDAKIDSKGGQNGPKMAPKWDPKRSRKTFRKHDRKQSAK